MATAARALNLPLAAPFYSPARRRCSPVEVDLRRCGRGRRFGLVAHASSGTETLKSERNASVLLKIRASEMYDDLKGTSIFLIGMNCALKSMSGQCLADALRYYYFDSDSLVVEATGGESSAKLLKESDELGFFESETEVLKQLSSMGRLVVSAGDGAVRNSTNLGLLRYGISVWVDVPIEIIANEPSSTENAASSDSSALLDDLVKKYNALKGSYGTADATVSLENVASKVGFESLDLVTPEDIALEVLEQVGKLMRVKKMMEDAARPF